MDGENREIQEKAPEEKGGDTHPPVPVVNAEAPNKSRSEGANQRKESATLDHISRWSRFKEWLFHVTAAEAGMFLLTLVIAASSIAYTMYAKRQWRVMRESNAINRENVESVQRALVFFTGQTPIVKRLIGKKVTSLTMVIPWENTGVTPAMDGKSVVNWKTFPSPNGLPNNFTYPDMVEVEPRQFEIPPRSSGNGTMDVPIGWIKATKDKGLRMFIYGWITYDDIFRGVEGSRKTPRHLSEFCDEITSIKSTQTMLQTRLAISPGNSRFVGTTIAATRDARIMKKRRARHIADDDQRDVFSFGGSAAGISMAESLGDAAE